MQKLIEQIHKATGPDREIDREIARANGYTVEVIRVPVGHPVFKEGGGLEFMQDARSKPGDAPAPKMAIPPYTASIEAAMTLMEPGWEYSISTLYGVADVEMPLNASDTPPVATRRQDGNVALAICESAMVAKLSDKVPA